MKDLWIDTRLTEEEMDFLWQIVSEENKEDLSDTLVGNISKSELIIDKDNWFYESVLKDLTERMFYRDWDNYYKYHIEVGDGVSLPKFEMNSLWVNYQKQHEFNPLPHIHTGLYSFVVFMKIPTHWKEQHALPFSANSCSPCASDFQFVWTQKDIDELKTRNFSLSPEDEGRMLFFPGNLQHQVYPFYECEEERITISGNIVLEGNKEVSRLFGDVYEEKVQILKMLENSFKLQKKVLEYMI